MDKIKKHYVDQAKKFGASKQSTMTDVNIRDKEVEKILESINTLKSKVRNPKVLEVGCGNGYTAEQIACQTGIESLTCIDFCEDLIKIAKRRGLKDVDFDIGDVLNMDFEDSSFDIVLTERCLINLKSWKKQEKALDEIRRVLRVGGFYLMLESFKDALDNLNEARGVVGLEPIAQPFHNLYFGKERFLRFIEGKFENCNNAPGFASESHENFLSSYYFGSRVLYPALVAGKQELVYNNKFVEFFRYLPPYGSYSYVQMFILKKI